MVGDGEAREEVAQLFSSMTQRVHFHGQIEGRADLTALYETADLFVWPAVNEAYGMVLLEAQALGCAVAAGAYGGVASVVPDGETGTLTPPGDVTAFADALSDLLQDWKRLEPQRQRVLFRTTGTRSRSCRFALAQCARTAHGLERENELARSDRRHASVGSGPPDKGCRPGAGFCAERA